jgi:hypothetical protein
MKNDIKNNVQKKNNVRKVSEYLYLLVRNFLAFVLIDFKHVRTNLD